MIKSKHVREIGTPTVKGSIKLENNSPFDVGKVKTLPSTFSNVLTSIKRIFYWIRHNNYGS